MGRNEIEISNYFSSCIFMGVLWWIWDIDPGVAISEWLVCLVEREICSLLDDGNAKDSAGSTLHIFAVMMNDLLCIDRCKIDAR